jgi:hypothetical protein
VRILSVFSKISTCVAQVVQSNAGSVFSCSVPERGGGDRGIKLQKRQDRRSYERILFMIVISGFLRTVQLALPPPADRFATL